MAASHPSVAMRSSHSFPDVRMSRPCCPPGGSRSSVMKRASAFLVGAILFAMLSIRASIAETNFPDADLEGGTLNGTDIFLPVGTAQELTWPIECVPGRTCNSHIGYPDINRDGRAFNCGAPGYLGHQGTDIGLTWAQMDKGVNVLASAPGEVLWVFDGKYDRCPNFSEPDCQAGPQGYRVCTQRGPYCGQGVGSCRWCFAGGNVVVMRHTGVDGVFATRYDHLKKNSIVVTEGELVEQGQKIAEAGSAGNSSGPNLHF